MHYLPYDDLAQNRQESINEVTVTFGSYFLFMFTPWIVDEEFRYTLGWNLVGFIAANVVFNFTLAGMIAIR